MEQNMSVQRQKHGLDQFKSEVEQRAFELARSLMQTNEALGVGTDTCKFITLLVKGNMEHIIQSK